MIFFLKKKEEENLNGLEFNLNINIDLNLT